MNIIKRNEHRGFRRLITFCLSNKRDQQRHRRQAMIINETKGPCSLLNKNKIGYSTCALIPKSRILQTKDKLEGYGRQGQHFRVG